METTLRTARPTFAQRWTVLSVCAVVYLYAFPYFEPVNNPNENVRFFMTAAIVEDGTYAIDGIRSRWGWVNDAACVDRGPDGRIDGCQTPTPEGGARHYYSVKAPGASLLGVPFYAAYWAWSDGEVDRATALWVCRVGASVLPWLLFLSFLYGVLGREAPSPLARDAVFFTVAIGSCAYAYGMMFVSHVQSAAALFGAFLLLERARRSGGRLPLAHCALAGFLTASVTLFEYPGLIASVGLSFYALVALRLPGRPAATLLRLALFGLGALGPTLAMMHFQHAAFGAFYSPGHRFMESASFRANHNQGFFGATELHGEALWAYFLHPGKGLFPLSPLLLFAIPGFGQLVRARRTRLEALLALLIIGLTTLAVAFQIHWTGGWVIGPRYLVFAYPFLAWAALVGMRGPWRRAPGTTAAAVLGLTLVGFVMSGASSLYFPHYPERMHQPMPQLIAMLFAHDYAPFTVVNHLGVFGTASMLPLFGLFFAIWLWLGLRGSPRRAAVTLVAGAVLGGLLLWPLLTDFAPGDADVLEDRAYVTRRWRPSGHDRAARLERALNDDPSAELAETLAAVYEVEGRTREAASVRRRARRAARPSGE